MVLYHCLQKKDFGLITCSERNDIFWRDDLYYMERIGKV